MLDRIYRPRFKARLVKELFARNELTQDDVVSILFTSTPDLTAEFPASAARTALGLDQVALLGAQEQDVAHGTRLCIRVLVHCYTGRPRDQLHHVFLEGAAALRADLAASGDDALQPENLKSSPMGSWIGRIVGIGVAVCGALIDRKSTRLNSSHT